MEKSVVLIGGGHGLSNLVKGFKNEKLDLNVIVSSTDDGGHTGRIRDEFSSVAVGDLRMVLNELIDEGSVLKDIFNYRFQNLHGISNVSLGNLMIASLWEKYMDATKVIRYFKDKEKIKANIFLSSNNPLVLCAECDDGEIIKYERVIGVSNKKIKKLFVDKESVCEDIMLEKIEKADLIVLSPGSLYTSVGAVLCIDKIKEAIQKSCATIIYVCNIMSQYGETDGYGVSDHVMVLEKIMGRTIDRVLVNSGQISDDILEKYKEENSSVVRYDELNDKYELYNLVDLNDGSVRHNSELVKKIILGQQ